MSDDAHLPVGHEPNHQNHHEMEPKPTGFWRSKAGLVTVGFLAVGGFFLVTEHRAHLMPYLGYLPFLLIFACLPMHFFMHGGHGHHGPDTNTDDNSSDDRQKMSGHHH